MQEQPPSEPPRREPATSTRRSRSPKPTFTPPTTDPDVPASRKEPEDRIGQTRPRRAKAAPAVLFQPPDPAQAASRAAGAGATASRPAEGTAPIPRPAPGGTASAVRPTDAAVVRQPTADEPDPEPAARRAETGAHRSEPEPAEQGPSTGRTAPKAARKTAPKKATPAAKKATPGAGKRTGRSRSDLGDDSSDAQHGRPAPRQAGSPEGASGQAGAAEPTGPVASAGATAEAPAAGPVGPVNATTAEPGAPTSDTETTPAAEPAAPAAAPEPANAASHSAAGPAGPAGPAIAPEPANTASGSAAAPVGPAGPATPDPAADPVGSAGTTAARPEPERLAAAGRAKKASTPKKSAPRGTTPKKVTPAKKAATPAKKAATPAPPAAESAPEPASEVETAATAETRETAVVPAIAVPGRTLAVRDAESGRTAGAEWRAISARLLDHPGFAPELLALAAVEALGPRARDWADGLRAGYPDADPDGLARLAARRFVRLAGTGGAVAAGAGLLAPVAELAAVLWTQANLVLHLAAAYGRDPSHPDRAVELLVLTQVHPDADSARAALDAARTADGPGERPWPRAAEAAWRLAAPLAAQAGGWLGLRLASRLLPGAALLAAAAGNAAAAERLAARAISVYRPARRR